MVVRLRCAAYILGLVIAIQVENVVALRCYCRDPHQDCDDQKTTTCSNPNAVCYKVQTRYGSHGYRKGCAESFVWCESKKKELREDGQIIYCCKGDLCNGARTINTTSWTQVLLTLAVLMMIKKLML